MPATISKDDCNACGTCVDACPMSIIEMDDVAALTDESECTDCGSCVDACPSEAISL